jgi:hypothetical protein
MKIMQGCLYFALMVCLIPAVRAAEWQLIEASYLSLPVPVSQYGTVCSAYDTSVCADVSNFYQLDQRTLLRVTAVGALSPRWGLRLSFTTGAKSQKLVVEPKLLVGVIAIKELAGGRSLVGEIFGSVGGETRHIPCLDVYDRAYFCGNLTAWADYPNKQIAADEYGFKLVYKF